MQYKAILFDLDGTLLPMDMHTFTKGYFTMLAKKLAPFGIETKTLIDAVWTGTAAMVKNDGSAVNGDRFWDGFSKCTAVEREKIEPMTTEFYGSEFAESKIFTGENPLAVRAVELARKKAEKVVLATNPLFPTVGQNTRMRFVGLEPEMFDLVTSCNTDRYCKPNPAYYTDVCDRIGVRPEACLMIGNDEYEDMYAASSIGMDCCLITDCAIPSAEHPWTGRRMRFAELVEFLETL